MYFKYTLLRTSDLEFGFYLHDFIPCASIYSILKFFFSIKLPVFLYNNTGICYKKKKKTDCSGNIKGFRKENFQVCYESYHRL